MIHGIRLKYNDLRKIDPKTAREAVIQVYKSVGKNVSKTAVQVTTTRRTIYKILKRYEHGEDLCDRSRRPHTSPNKTPKDIEEIIIEIKNRTNYGPKRISKEMYRSYDIDISKHTIRHVLRRNRDRLKRKFRKVRKGKREFVDWYTAKPFEIVQVDLKYIVDQKALSRDQIDHIYAHKLPLYQWSALDVNSRFKLIAYSDEKSWTNGLVWYLWITSWLRSHGVTSEIVYTVDNGEEFGGKSFMKMKELRKLLKGLGCRVIQNRKGHCEENAHVERSHRTDDDEFYIPRIDKINNRDEFYNESFQYIYYYNCVREHSSLDDKTPYNYLKMQCRDLDDRIRYVPPIHLDTVSIQLGHWGGYHVLAKHLVI